MYAQDTTKMKLVPLANLCCRWEFLPSSRQTPTSRSSTIPSSYLANHVLPSKIWKVDRGKEKQIREGFFITINLMGVSFDNASMVISLEERERNVAIGQADVCGEEVNDFPKKRLRGILVATYHASLLGY